MNNLHNNQITALAMVLTAVLAVAAMLCTAFTANAQTVGQPWDSSWDKPVRSSTMHVDSTMTNFEVCRAAKKLKRGKYLTNKAKREYCKPYRQEVILMSAFIALSTPTYPYYYAPQRVIIIR